MSSYLGNSVFDAISSDNGYAIYQHYGYLPSKKAQKENPFREERSSSFYINPKGYFKDFGDDEIKGNAINFIERKEGCSKKEAIKIASEIYGLVSPSQKRKRRKLKKKAAKAPKEVDTKKELIEIIFRKPNNEELKYWQVKADASREVLESEGIKTVEQFTIKYTNPKTGKYWVKSYEHQRYVFAIEITPGKAYKLIQVKPDQYGYGKGKTSFLPNLDIAKEQNQDYVFSLGIDKLRPNEPAYLCEGEKDYLLLKSKGYNAFTLGNAVSEFKPYTLSLLEAQRIDLSNIVVLYDTDYAGLTASSKLARAHSLRRVIIPKLDKQHTQDAPKPKLNDLCDYKQRYSFDKALEKTLSNPEKPPIQVKVKELEDSTHIKIGNHYLSNHKRENNELDSVLDANPLAILEAKAGTGKTEYIFFYARRIKKRLILCLPYQSLTRQQATRLEASLKNCIGFTGESFTYQVIDGNSSEEETEQAKQCDIVAVTYDSIHKIESEFDSKNTLFVIDEFHNLVNQYGYRKDAIDKLMPVLKRFEQSILLSATPNVLFKELGYKHIQVQTKAKNFVQLHRIDYSENKLQKIYDLIADTPKDKLSVIKLGKGIERTSKELIEALTTLSGIKKEQIGLIYNKALEIEENTTYENIISNELVPDGIRFLFCSPKITDGVNIKNTNIHKVIFVDEFEPDNMIQFLARFRKMEKLKAYSLRKEDKEGYEIIEYREFIDHKDYAEDTIKVNQAKAEYNKRYKDLVDPAKTSEFYTCRYITDDNQFNFNQAAFDARQKFNSSLSLDHFYNIVTKKAGNIEVKAYSQEHKENEAFSNLIKVNMEKQKNEKEQAEVKTFKLIKEDLNLFFEILYHHTKNRELKKTILKHFPYFHHHIISPKANLLLDNHKSFFEEYNKLIVKIAKRFLFCYSFLFYKFMSTDEILNFIDEKGSGFDRWKKAMKMYYAKFLVDKKIKVDYRLKIDVNRMNKDLESLLNLKGQEFKEKDLTYVLNSHSHRKYKSEKIRGKDFSELMYAYFPETLKYDKNKKVYTGIEKTSFLKLLPEEINRMKYREYCQTLLETSCNKIPHKTTDNQVVKVNLKSNKGIKNFISKVQVNTPISLKDRPVHVPLEECPF